MSLKNGENPKAIDKAVDTYDDPFGGTIEHRFKPFAKATLRVKNNRTGFVFKSPKPMRIFVDTGADHTVLPTQAMPTLREHTGDFDTVPAKVETVNGVKDAMALKDVSVCLNAICYRGNVVVLDSVNGDVIMGSDFLASRKCSVDFNKKRIVCEGREIRLNLEE